jgi:hypothetical protein
MRIDKQHCRIRNLQTDPNGALVSHLATNESFHGPLSKPHSPAGIAKQNKKKKKERKREGDTPDEVFRIAMHEYGEA